ncbi:hypothetical protein GQ457_05G013190 [Hibiscus cannabinus]
MAISVDIDSSGGRDEGMKDDLQTLKLFFRDMVLGVEKGSVSSRAIPYLDVEVRDEDVTMSTLDGTLMIAFSGRLHDLIDEKLANSVVVCLLGRSIGFSALENMIKTFWKPSGEIALIDLDNDYYLVRFAQSENCSKVLMGGPWIIYGCYLTVQPWSRNFSTEGDHPTKIVVWARLSGLPYRYYTKSIFRIIVGTMGKIARIDYNTNEGRRDTNKSNEVVDMSILTPEEKFGPWMQVQPRKNRRGATGKGAIVAVNVNRFDALRIEDECIVATGELATNMDGHTSAQFASGINQNGKGKILVNFGKPIRSKDLSKNKPNATIGNATVSDVVDLMVSSKKKTARTRGSVKLTVGLGDRNTTE